MLNLWELTRFALDKKMKEIWFCSEDTPSEKAARGFALCDAMAEQHLKYLYGKEYVGNKEQK